MTTMAPIQLPKREVLNPTGFPVRFSEEDEEYIRTLAADGGVSVATVVREIVKSYKADNPL